MATLKECIVRHKSDRRPSSTTILTVGFVLVATCFLEGPTADIPTGTWGAAGEGPRPVAMAVPLIVENSFGTAFLRDTDASQCRQSSVAEAVTTGIFRNMGGTRFHRTSIMHSVDCVHSAQIARPQRSETGGTPG